MHDNLFDIALVGRGYEAEGTPSVVSNDAIDRQTFRLLERPDGLVCQVAENPIGDEIQLLLEGLNVLSSTAFFNCGHCRGV